MYLIKKSNALLYENFKNKSRVKNNLDRKINKKILIFLLIIQQLIITFLLIFFLIYKNLNYNDKFLKNNTQYLEELYNNKLNKIDYENNSFAILRKTACLSCGFFSYYILYLTCIKTFIINGYIPIIEVISFPNIFNGFKINATKENPWEYFFNQPFGYSLERVEKFAKNKKYFECPVEASRPRFIDIYYKKATIYFWHYMTNKYMPIKETIIKESNLIMQNLFKSSDNILGILIRGTDYLAIKPRGHPIPQNSAIVIKDVKEMEKKNKYKWFFIATEDSNIRNKFILEFGEKLKYILPKEKIEYNYKNDKYLAFNKNIKGNLEFLKTYLINIIILSKCIDIITCRTNGSVGAFILSESFRNFKVYNLGLYK